jgi:hypothetical protein
MIWRELKGEVNQALADFELAVRVRFPPAIRQPGDQRGITCPNGFFREAATPG